MIANPLKQRGTCICGVWNLLIYELQINHIRCDIKTCTFIIYYEKYN